MQYLANRVSDFDLDKTALMDEASVLFEDARNTTVDVTVSRHVAVCSTGIASIRVTVVLASSVHSVLVAEQPKAWVDSELLVNWLDRAFPGVLSGDGQAIVWDSMRTHISGKVKAKRAQKDIEMCVIPGGLTAYIQAGDIGIYKVFKNLFSDLIDAWKRSDQVTYTRGGNPRPPPVETVCDWVKQACRDTPLFVVQNSIEAAGFRHGPQNWFMWDHDVNWRKFQRAWTQHKEEESKSGDVEDDAQESDGVFNLAEEDCALDDIDLIDS
ncbi:unnamed protein product [Phytophthora fragariaefolia]|uniref:Unnamed protein product n=1 Tax=Phytophthora fragariaefolia TaxID=1490495 RepID=A0A9W7D2Y2_9STRA|nr:unnamed protein product [Phytophthora fragariaefolia]